MGGRPVTVRYFRLRDDVALDAEGNPEPIREVGVALVRPALDARGRLVEQPERVVVTAHPADDRVVATDDPQIAGGIMSTGLFMETDPPESKRRATKAGGAGETSDAGEA